MINNRNCLSAGLILMILWSLGACTSLPVASNTNPLVRYRPDWWLYQSPEDAYLYSYGQGHSTSRDKSLNAATTNAYDEAAMMVEAHLSEIVGIFSREAGVVDPKALNLTEKLIHAIANARYGSSVVGEIETRQLRERGKPLYKSWVQIKIPKAEINANLINNLSYDESLSSLFKNSPSYRRMALLISQP